MQHYGVHFLLVGGLLCNERYPVRHRCNIFMGGVCSVRMGTILWRKLMDAKDKSCHNCTHRAQGYPHPCDECQTITYDYEQYWKSDGSNWKPNRSGTDTGGK
ncbi:hypothetical protein LCGC14_2517870 [marine sediment metagenome]|uniref:Uncharacterized protein n=1 Tax=marine sediment metagenome TaxID=412755 RepID=A0A0F9AXA3_9ZZZZ